MAEPKRISSFYSDLEEFIPFEHRRFTGRNAIFQAMSNTMEGIETKLYDLRLAATFSTSSGKELDFWGFLAGEPRGGLTDSQYRRVIGAAMRAKHVDGNVSSITELWQFAMAPCTVEFERGAKNLMELYAYREGADFLPESVSARLARVVRRACPVGSVVLYEAVGSNYVGDVDRIAAPLPAPKPGRGFALKEW